MRDIYVFALLSRFKASMNLLKESSPPISRELRKIRGSVAGRKRVRR
jgi:hypothetical protein